MEIIKQKDGNATRVTVITDKGGIATGNYYDYSADSTINDVITRTIEEAKRRE